MRFRPTRVVHVTTKEALDSALVSADQVVVEGDDQLLSYAAAKASHDPELARVDIEIAGRSISVGRDAVGSIAVGGNAVGNIVISGYRNTGPPIGGTGNGELPSPLPPPPPPAPMASAPPRRSGFAVLLGFAIAFALMAVASFGYFALTAADKAAHVQTSGSQSPAIAGTQGNVSISPIPAEPAASSNLDGVPQILASLTWPAVAIAAIVALFFIARQAIAGGRNVEISWKVTEKVTGRVVITKVRSRASNTRSAA